jgi:hypothetical protein
MNINPNNNPNKLNHNQPPLTPSQRKQACIEIFQNNLERKKHVLDCQYNNAVKKTNRFNTVRAGIAGASLGALLSSGMGLAQRLNNTLPNIEQAKFDCLDNKISYNSYLSCRNLPQLQKEDNQLRHRINGFLGASLLGSLSALALGRTKKNKKLKEELKSINHALAELDDTKKHWQFDIANGKAMLTTGELHQLKMPDFKTHGQLGSYPDRLALGLEMTDDSYYDILRNLGKIQREEMPVVTLFCATWAKFNEKKRKTLNKPINSLRQRL